MTIELINQESFDILVKIQEKHPLLTYQNKGYDYPDKSKWSEEDNIAFKDAEAILRSCVDGFSHFNHFRMSKNAELEVRFQYDYGKNDPTGHQFIGVGYLKLKELRDGFDKS